MVEIKDVYIQVFLCVCVCLSTYNLNVKKCQLKCLYIYNICNVYELFLYNVVSGGFSTKYQFWLHSLKVNKKGPVAFCVPFKKKKQF